MDPSTREDVTWAIPNIAEAYIGFVGHGEPDNRQAIEELDVDDPVRASLLIGNACFFLCEGLDKVAGYKLEEAIESMYPWDRNDDPRFASIRSAAGHLILIAEMIDDRGNLKAAQIYREVAHTQTVAEALRAGDILKDSHASENVCLDTIKEAAGERAQKNALGMLTRVERAELAAFPALLHHDRSMESTGNHDIVVVKADPATGECMIREAQVKRPCLWYCSRPGYTAGEHEDRNKYSYRIVLISEECDLVGEEGNPRKLAKLLNAELEGGAAPSSIDKLDLGTERLVQNITNAPELRRGTRPDLPRARYLAKRRGELLLPSVAREG